MEDLVVDVLVDVGLLMLEEIGSAEKYVGMRIYPEGFEIIRTFIFIRIDTACYG